MPMGETRRSLRRSPVRRPPRRTTIVGASAQDPPGSYAADQDVRQVCDLWWMTLEQPRVVHATQTTASGCLSSCPAPALRRNLLFSLLG